VSGAQGPTVAAMATHISAISSAAQPGRRRPKRSRVQPRSSATMPEGLRFRDLRHTAATLAVAAGASIRELMERMGHTSPTIAVRYQHVMRGRDAAVADALDRLAEAAGQDQSGTDVAREEPAGGRRGSGSRPRSGWPAVLCGRDGRIEPATPCSQRIAG
jgi:hypothetical protein